MCLTHCFCFSVCDLILTRITLEKHQPTAKIITTITRTPTTPLSNGVLTQWQLSMLIPVPLVLWSLMFLICSQFDGTIEAVFDEEGYMGYVWEGCMIPCWFTVTGRWGVSLIVGKVGWTIIAGHFIGVSHVGQSHDSVVTGGQALVGQDSVGGYVTVAQVGHMV